MTSSARLNSLIESPASGSEQPFSMMEEEVVGALMLALNPGFDALTSRLRDLELHGTLRLALRDQSATRNAPRGSVFAA